MSSAGPWETLAATQFENEAAVETLFVQPLLESLGYEKDDIAPKVPVSGYSPGRRGRKPEADFVCYARRPHDADTSLLVVEVKRPGESFEDAEKQGRFYATWLQAPLYLVTDGARLQLWQTQLVRQPHCVFDWQRSDFVGKRAQVEALLSKDAVIALLDILEIKRIEAASLDLTKYVQALGARLVESTIPRTVVDSHLKRIPENDLLEHFRGGVIVTGPTGLGKTTLARRLSALALERFLERSDTGVPLVASLADISLLAKGIEGYLRDRVSAHSPAAKNVEAFRDVLRKGAVMILDAYDRISDNQSKARTCAELRSIREDFPRCQLIIVSKPGSVPNIALPNVTLTDLSAAEITALAELKFSIPADEMQALYRMLPGPLKVLSHNPYFLDLVIREHKSSGEVPRNISQLLERFVNALYAETDRNISEVAKAAAVAAEASRQGPITRLQAAQALGEAGLAQSLLPCLVDAGLVKQGETVEIAHEILGTYLRAQAVPPISTPEQLRSYLQQQPDLTSSTLPLFLAENENVRAHWREFWRYLGERSVAAYVTAVQSPLDLSKPAELPTAEWQLGEILDGYEDLRLARFPQIATTLAPFVPTLKGEYGACIEGGTSAGGTRACFAFKESASDGPRVKVFSDVPRGEWQRYHWHDLGLAKIAPSAARRVGVYLLRKSLEKLVKEGPLRGQLMWAKERILGLLEELDSQMLVQTLAEIQSALTKHHGLARLPNGEEIDFDDLKELLGRFDKKVRPNEWALPGPDLLPPTTFCRLDDAYSDAQTQLYLQAVYTRAMQCYREVVESSFGEVASELRHYPQWPKRIEAFVENGQYGKWLGLKWSPVSGWDESRVDVFMHVRIKEDVEEEAERLRAELAALGRPSQTICVGHRTRFPVGNEGMDTAVSHIVRSWLKDDVSHLFRDLSKGTGSFLTNP